MHDVKCMGLGSGKSRNGCHQEKSQGEELGANSLGLAKRPLVSLLSLQWTLGYGAGRWSRWKYEPATH